MTLLLASLATLSLAACSEEIAEVTFEPVEVLTDMEASVPTEELVELMDLDETMVQELYGISPDLLVSFVARMPMMNVQCEEYFIAEVTEGNMEEVKELLLARQATLVEQWGMYLPDQLEMVEDYQLVENGDYIAFAIGYNADAVIEAFNAKFE